MILKTDLYREESPASNFPLHNIISNNVKYKNVILKEKEEKKK